MEKEDTVSVQWAQEDVETSYSLLNNNNKLLGPQVIAKGIVVGTAMPFVV